MGANFTPVFNPYSGQGAFRYWCQTVLPLVYDDSLSYYELLNKMVVYLNNTIADVKTVEDNLDATKDAYISLQDYVNDEIEDITDYTHSHIEDVEELVEEMQNYMNNYFDNLDVQQEINAKLDEMASDGTLSALFAPIIAEDIPSLVTSWLNENVDPVGSAVVVDSSLSISGAAADSKVTGDRFNDIDSALNQTNVEIIWEQGSMNSGEDVASTWGIRSKNLIPVNSSDIYYSDMPSGGRFVVSFYDSNKAWIGNAGAHYGGFDVDESAKYFRVMFYYDTSTDITIEEGNKVHFYNMSSDVGGIIKSFADEYPIDEWESNTLYLVGRKVKYNGGYYCCKTEHTSGDSFDSSKFSGVALARVISNIQPEIKLEYITNSPDQSTLAGKYFYNYTINAVEYVLSEQSDGAGFVAGAIPYCKSNVFVLDGKKLKWDDTLCNLVAANEDFSFETIIPDLSYTGKGVKTNGDITTASAYNISEPIELMSGDCVWVRTYVSASYSPISKTNASQNGYTPLAVGIGTSVYKYEATEHCYIALTLYASSAKVFIYRRKQIKENIVPNWEMQGFFNQFGSIRWSNTFPNYKISTPLKLYEGDKVKISCYAVTNDPVLMEFQDRWNTYWANALGNRNVLIMPDETGWKYYHCIVPKTSWYVFCCNTAEEYTPEIEVIRSKYSQDIIDTMNVDVSDNYSLDKHNYVDTYDFVPDMTKSRANSILTYSADDKSSSNFIVNAVAYPTGEIIACRAGGDVVKISNDGTETTLMTIPNAQDWRGCFIDSNLNVYVSPHSSTFSPGIDRLDRGLYRLAYGGTSFTKVISLCRSLTEISVWEPNTVYNVGDKIFRDNESDFYICNTDHTSGSTFDTTKWTAVGSWTANTSYTVGSLCKYNKLYFRCTNAHTSSSTFDYTKWNAATEYMSNDDTIWTMCEDCYGNIFAGVYSHSTRANPSIYFSANKGVNFRYQSNFIMSGTLPNTVYGDVRHVHCVNYNPYDDCLYAAVGEVNTICKSSNRGNSWVDLAVGSYYGQPTYVIGVKDGLVIGSDGHYSCGVSKLLTDGKTMKLCGRTAPGFIFNIRRSDLTGWLYAWTRIDNVVQSSENCPPYDAIDNPSVLADWIENAPDSILRYWNPYHEWASKYYPEDAVRPQNVVIMVSKDEGDTWEVINKVKVSQNNASICGYITVGYFRDGECLAGLLKPIDGTTSGKAFVQPVVLSEGKKKHDGNKLDLTGEIFIKTNSTNLVEI